MFRYAYRLLLGALLVGCTPALTADLVIGSAKRAEVNASYADLDKLVSLGVCSGTPLVCDYTMLPEQIRTRAQMVVDEYDGTTLADDPSNGEMAAAATAVAAGSQVAARATTSAAWAKCASMAECRTTSDTIATAIGIQVTATSWNYEDGDKCGMRFETIWATLDCSP